MKSPRILLKRAYEAPSRSDGQRVLVDRVWPRGVSRKEARLDAWLKDIAPSDALRKRFGHDPERWGEFQDAYRRELAGQSNLLQALRDMARRGTLTLVYGAKDREHNQAVVLKQVLEQDGD